MLVPFFVQKPVKKRFYMYSLLENIQKESLK